MVFSVILVKHRDVEGVSPLGELEQTNPLGESLVTKPRDHQSVPRSVRRPKIFSTAKTD